MLLKSLYITWTIYSSLFSRENESLLSSLHRNDVAEGERDDKGEWGKQMTEKK